MLNKKYNHTQVEIDKYENWLKKDYFKSGDTSREPFCIVIPPPNVTGKLHLGHAWDTTLQDIITRYKRMQGYDALWLPGMDHAGVATQAKIDQRLKNEGIDPRSMGREEWLKLAWSWKEEYAQIIRKQWSKLGLSLDYSKERFTFDEGLNKAVNKVFIDLYNKGLIYKGEKIINFDPFAKTALSNVEVIYKEVDGEFYHLKYKLEDSEEYLTVATTRPETLFGDTAVAVNPKDERYKKLIGKNVILPIVNKKIPIISDDYAEVEFGTGVVKITPAHDPNDFEVGNRHNLERIKCIDLNGKMNHNAITYEGLDRFECRKKLIEDLNKQDLLIKIEKIKHSVGFSERSDVMVEPVLSMQWFVKMKPLAEEVLRVQGIKGEKVEFVPKRFEKILINWMSNIQDWCISRQVWWGHRIPAWYKGDEIYVGIDCPGEGWVQDEDVLDTWFSSALWPFSTLGWPENLDNRYFPNNVLVTGYDIIFFWVSRMIFTSLEFNNEKPFDEVVIHGLIRDKNGVKMSKSLGNGVDPMDVIEKYGADSLRYFLTTNTAPGMDLRYDEEKVKSTWNFINKIWNASRFVLMDSNSTNDLTKYDKWILTKLNNTINVVKNNMEKYEFQNVGTELYNFIWNDFCDWYIEFSKVKRNNLVLQKVLIDILKMLHPFMPFVTEEIYSKLEDNSIMISKYPIYDSNSIYMDEYNEIEEIKEFIVDVRNKKSENNITKDSKMEFICGNKEISDILRKVLKLNEINIEDDKTQYKQIICETKDNSLLGKIIITFYTKELIENKEDILKEIEQLKNNIKRREALLSNEGYLKNAPTNLIEEEKKKLMDEKFKTQDLENKI